MPQFRTFIISIFMLSNICYSDNQAITIVHKKGFSRCYKSILQWATINKNKYHFSDIESVPDSGLIRVTSIVECASGFSAISDTINEDLILTSHTNSLTIEFEAESDSMACLPEQTAKQNHEKQEITQLILGLPDTDQSASFLVTKENVVQSIRHNRSYSGWTKQDLLADRLSGLRVLTGVLAIIGGITSGVLTVVDANGSDEIKIPNYYGLDEPSYGYHIKTVPHRWTTDHTVSITISITAIAAGIVVIVRENIKKGT